MTSLNYRDLVKQYSGLFFSLSPLIVLFYCCCFQGYIITHSLEVEFRRHRGSDKAILFITILVYGVRKTERLDYLFHLRGKEVVQTFHFVNRKSGRISYVSDFFKRMGFSGLKHEGIVKSYNKIDSVPLRFLFHFKILVSSHISTDIPIFIYKSTL